jgi:hypothetical protein
MIQIDVLVVERPKRRTAGGSAREFDVLVAAARKRRNRRTRTQATHEGTSSIT